ncbi:tripartite motif-containing protein 40-like [Drosophila miranda]|uniref:tripartite motif-containing protein 40-like n=1 Tax=Drosophila miranda TaxID=7229 RepID=UPI00143F993A|nr:tripartite motif-containing protein 40-like [Drosophila miranda]
MDDRKDPKSEPKMRRKKRYGSGDVCTICLLPKKEAVATKCGHSFCKKCISLYLHYISDKDVLCCPVCRTDVESYSDEE